MLNCLLVAEIGINHNGDFEIVKKLIDAAYLSGCNFVKFQKRTIDLVYTKEELDKYRESPWGTTNREQKEGLELSLDTYCLIDKYCKDKGIGWFASPWDIESVDFLMQFDLPFIKIPSALITNIPLLEKIKTTEVPVIISCGMSNKKEIDNCLEILGNQVMYILSCTSSYPTPINEINMSRILSLKRYYGIEGYKIGFSNHCSGIPFILQAYLMNCEMIEFHITLDRSMYGTDQSASIEPEGLYKINKYIKAFKEGWGNYSIGCLPSELPIKEKLRKC